MENILSILIIVICVIVILYLFFTLLKDKIKEEKEMKKYFILKDYKTGDGTNFLDCPLGCNRGICETKNSKDKKHCQYNFQCQYCEDRNTHQFYVGANFENEQKIIPTYTQPEVRSEDVFPLNRDIHDNNEYIRQLNKKIKEENEKR